MGSISRRLGIERWMVFGGSWGSTLAIAYGEAHPDRCLGFVLRGIFLCRPQEIDWFLHGIRSVFPEAWRAFAGFLPEAERSDLLTIYYARLTHPDPAVHLPAARAWSVYEGSCSTLLPSPDTVAAFGEDRMALGLARIEAHYFINEIFLPPGQLLAEIHRLRRIPAIILQGLYAMVCPAVTADNLSEALPEAGVAFLPRARNSRNAPGTLQHVLDVITDMYRL